MTIQKTPPQNPDAPVFNGHRGELHEVVFNYARDELGIPIYLGCRIKQYFETETEAGIVFEDGSKVTGDVVIGSDGVRSKARELVLGILSIQRRFVCYNSHDRPLRQAQKLRICSLPRLVYVDCLLKHWVSGSC